MINRNNRGLQSQEEKKDDSDHPFRTTTTTTTATTTTTTHSNNTGSPSLLYKSGRNSNIGGSTRSNNMNDDNWYRQQIQKHAQKQLRQQDGDNDDDPRHRPFPRWAEETSEDSKMTIVESVVDFVKVASGFYSPFLVGTASTALSEKEPAKIVFERHPVAKVHQKTSDHWEDVGGSLPETLYVVSPDGLYVSNTAIQIFEQYYNGMFGAKLHSTQNLLILAYNILFKSDNCKNSNHEFIKDRWPLLYRVFHQKRSMSLPMLLFHGDYSGCNTNNWGPKKDQTVPLFTVAGNVD
jgi:hypothetical protein